MLSLGVMPSASPRLKTRDVRFSMRVSADPLAVYKALTSARELTRWWLLGAETDARNAGRVRMVWPRMKDEPDHALGEREGTFVDLEPGRKVAWLFKPARGEKGVPPLVSVFINPVRGGACEVILVHSGFGSGGDSERLRRGYARGWEDGLAKLKLYLETGRTCKLETVDLESVRVLSKARRP